jgi:hypothetical protein
MPEICVVHLVRAKNGLEPFKSFLDSYKRNPAGIDHELLIVFKGFDSKSRMLEYQQLLEPFPHKYILVNDFGYDIRAYFLAVKAFDYKFFLFLNSFSTILHKDWLLKMYRLISRDEVGLVGATGSYESPYSNVIEKIGPKAEVSLSGFKVKLPGLVRLVYEMTVRKVEQFVYGLRFDPFPNGHVRTNAFMVSSDMMRAIKAPAIITKMDAHRFECGKLSLTKQVLKMGKKALVVGKDGVGYDIDAWFSSRTFKSGSQENLLISDNQTRYFELSDSRQRSILTLRAWGLVD